ncbi:hypothetical protein BVY03_04600 [bacterium K02(2017)]|nr:hypothetical protein BVY03_04600 [bacterium K02(2017)]
MVPVYSVKFSPITRFKKEYLDSEKLAVQNKNTKKELKNTDPETLRLAYLQLYYLQKLAANQNKSVGQFLKDKTTSEGYGGNIPKWWPSLSKKDQADWQKRFLKALATVKAAAPIQLKKLITEAENKEGGIKFDPAGVEKIDSFAYNLNQTLFVGKSWVEAVEESPSKVFSNIAHELGGHRQYTDNYSDKIMKSTLTLLNADEKKLAESGNHSIFSAFAYMETEIYAELREMIYYIKHHSEGDDPYEDIKAKLERVKANFAPQVAIEIIKNLAAYLRQDKDTESAVYHYFSHIVKIVFKIDLMHLVY